MRLFIPLYRTLLIPLLVCCTALPVSAEGPGRLGTDVVPTFQSIHLTTDPAKNDYDGSVKIALRVDRPTTSFRFHSRGQELRRVVLNQGENEIPIEHERIHPDVVRVNTSAKLLAGTYELSIDFSADYSTQISGLFRTEDDAGAYLHTIFQPVDARQAFPCWDEPSFKIPFQVTLEVPADLVAISNTPEEKVDSTNGWKTYSFTKTPPLPSYDVAIAVGPFETVDIPGLSVPGRIVTAPGRAHQAATAVAMMPAILEALEKYFGSPHPFAKLDLLAAVGFPEGAFEAPGAVLFGENLLLLDEAAPAARRLNLLDHLAHEVAHMWFGNDVTLAWWDDIWLNEAFATWMSAKIAHPLYPELGMDTRALRATQSALELDGQPGSLPIRREYANAEEAFTVSSHLTYNKGRQVLNMFEGWIGPETFQQAVTNYLQEHTRGNATSADFLRALDKASNRDVSTAFNTFLVQPGFPLVRVRHADGHLVLSQQPFGENTAQADPRVWQVPVAVKIADDNGIRTQTFLLTKREQRFPMPVSPRWIAANADAVGYYRWELESSELPLLVHEGLTPLERLELTTNAEALLKIGKIDGGSFMTLLDSITQKELVGEPNPAVLTALVDAYEKLGTIFLTPANAETYALYLRQTLKPVLDTIGWQASAEEPGTLGGVRGRLFMLLGETGKDREAREMAAETVEAFLQGRSFTPELLRSSLKLAALDGDAALFKRYRERFETAPPMYRDDLVQGLAKFSDSALSIALLDEFLAGNLGFNEFFTMAFVLGRNDETVDIVFQWIQDNYKSVAERLPPFAMPYLAEIVGGNCSVTHLRKVEAFFEDPAHRTGATANQLLKISEKVRACARLRQRESGAITHFLSNS